MMFKRKLLFFHIYIYKSILIFNNVSFGEVYSSTNQLASKQSDDFSASASASGSSWVSKRCSPWFCPQVDSVPGIFTLLETNSSHLKIHPWSPGDSYWKPSFLGAMLVSGRVTTLHLAHTHLHLATGPTGPTLASRIVFLKPPEKHYPWPMNQRLGMLFEPCHLGHRNVLNDQQVDVHFHLSSKATCFYSMDTKWVSQALTTRFHVRSKHLFFTVSHVLTSFHLESGWHWCLVCGFPC